MKNKIDVLFRVCHGEVTAFISEMPVNDRMIGCYSHTGQHGEADLGYYWESRKAKPEEYQELYEEMSSLYAPDEIVIKQRLNYTKLRNSWR